MIMPSWSANNCFEEEMQSMQPDREIKFSMKPRQLAGRFLNLDNSKSQIELRKPNLKDTSDEELESHQNLIKIIRRSNISSSANGYLSSQKTLPTLYGTEDKIQSGDFTILLSEEFFKLKPVSESFDKQDDTSDKLESSKSVSENCKKDDTSDKLESSDPCASASSSNFSVSSNNASSSTSNKSYSFYTANSSFSSSSSISGYCASSELSATESSECSFDKSESVSKRLGMFYLPETKIVQKNLKDIYCDNYPKIGAKKQSKKRAAKPKEDNVNDIMMFLRR